MNQAHLHLLLNHIPILGTLFALLVLAAGMLFRSQPVERAGLVSLVLVALAAIPAYRSGHEAEDTVEKIVGISKHYLEEHEELAEKAIWLLEATGVLALAALAWSFFRSTPGRLIRGITLAAALVTFGVMVQVGQHGGKIRHSEIRNSTLGWPDAGNGGSGGEQLDDD